MADSMRVRSGRRPCKKSPRRRAPLSRRLFFCCCSCPRPEERGSPPPRPEESDGGVTPQLPCLHDDGASGRGDEKETIRITVEDLGLVNPSFSPSEEEEDDSPSPADRTARNMARSVSSVSACYSRALRKKRLKPLSSLPLQPRGAESGATTGPAADDGLKDEEQEDDDDGDPRWFASGAGAGTCTAASGSRLLLLVPPVITLIPPTPSDVTDDDQFFDLNSEEESAMHTSGSEGSFTTGGDQESYEETMESVQGPQGSTGESARAENQDDGKTEPELKPKAEVIPGNTEEIEKPKATFLRGAYQVAPLPEYPWKKRRFNAGINLLSFTHEHNLDELSNKDVTYAELLRAQLHLLSHTAKMDAPTGLQRPATRTCSEGATVTRSRTLHVTPQVATQRNRKADEGSPRHRRITVASYMLPRARDQNGNSSEESMLEQPVVKTLGDLDTDEVCQWFSNIGLQKCLPFIREAGLRGADIASVDAKTLELLHVSTVEEKEHLLSAIYKELHPPSTITQRVDSLLETLGPNNSVERFTAALVSMSKSRSSPHVSCLNMNRSSLKLRNKSQSFMTQKSPQLIEITINASERIVHLRTPKDTTVGKVKESCIRMLGVTEDKDLFILKDKQGPSEELSPGRQIGSLLMLASENRQLELHLCKKEKPPGVDSQELPKVNGSHENGQQNGRVHQPAKEEKIRELNQQVDSLQNVILQVQELHHGLVAFCSELKSMDGEAEVAGLGTAELEQRLELVESQLRDKRQSLHSLRENIGNAAAHKNKRLEVRLLDKMKLNCEVFKEEISLVHLNRHMSHLENALQGSHEKRRSQSEGSSAALSALGQLVSPQCPVAMLLVVQESPGPDGRYAFTCRRTEGSAGGLVVVQVAGNSHLCVDDRLVEVNGFPVVNSTEEELSGLLLQGPGGTVPIVVLRRPPHGPLSRQHPVLLQHSSTTANPEKDTASVAATESPPPPPPQREMMAI